MFILKLVRFIICLKIVELAPNLYLGGLILSYDLLPKGLEELFLDIGWIPVRKLGKVIKNY
jgi:hypothetical protein